jgi:hypothetical protein
VKLEPAATITSSHPHTHCAPKEISSERSDGARRGSPVQNLRPSQMCRLGRVAGSGIIEPRRNNSAHLHRPWRPRQTLKNNGENGADREVRGPN